MTRAFELFWSAEHQSLLGNKARLYKLKGYRMSKQQFETILYQAEGAIGLVTLNRPGALNAVNRKVRQELAQVVDKIAGELNIRVVILTGAGDKAFAAGADVKEFEGMPVNEARETAIINTSLLAKFEALRKPIIAAINGFCLGGGFELALACDLRVASIKAKFGLPEINLGLIPGGGGTQRLAKVVGLAKAKELTFTGEMIDAEEALRLGLVNKIVPSEELMTEVRRLAEKLAQKSSIALALAKAAVNRSANIEGLSAHEGECFAQCFATKDLSEGIKAFLERRAPEFTGQ